VDAHHALEGRAGVKFGGYLGHGVGWRNPAAQCQRLSNGCW
jgi:hypothetical protein